MWEIHGISQYFVQFLFNILTYLLFKKALTWPLNYIISWYSMARFDEPIFFKKMISPPKWPHMHWELLHTPPGHGVTDLLVRYEWYLVLSYAYQPLDTVGIDPSRFGWIVQLQFYFGLLLCYTTNPIVAYCGMFWVVLRVSSAWVIYIPPFLFRVSCSG